MFGTTPRRTSSRRMRSAMFTTIRMWTHEGPDTTSRSAFTCCTCHHAFSCRSALAASNSFSSRRFPRVGASIRITATASAGGRGTGNDLWLRGSLTDGNVPPAEDLPGLHARATSALGGRRMLRAMHEHLLRIDNERAAALDILLLLADAEARWSDYARAIDLLDQAEDAGCILTPEYQIKRSAWDSALAG